MSEQHTGEARKMMFNTDLASKQKQDQQDVAIENLKAEITAMKDRITSLENG
jgi:cell division protein FtsB